MVTSGIPNPCGRVRSCPCDHVMSCPSETRGIVIDEEDGSGASGASWVRRWAGVARGRQGLGGRRAAGGALGRRR